jgi:signal transduction histidine kinase
VRSIRVRLTVVVAIVFAVAAAIGAVALVVSVERRLDGNTRASAEALLDNYLDSTSAGGRIVAGVAPEESGVFFYLDAQGNELTQVEYLEAIVMLHPPPPDDGSGQPVLTSESGRDGDASPQPRPGTDTPATAVFSFNADSERIGDVHAVDRGDDVIAVAQRVRFADAAEFEIGVASPTAPIDDSVAAIRQVLWVAIPLVTIAVALMTWVTADRALRPVQSIIRRTRSITANNMSARVPVPDSGDEVAELATTVNDMLNRLDDAHQRQRRFIADASHELRSPIAASRAQLEVALVHPDVADWPSTAANVLVEHEHLGHLVDDLLALSRLDETGLGRLEAVDIATMVDAESARPHHHPIITRIGDLPLVRGDRRQLVRAMRNLLDNADRHALHRVTVVAEPALESVLLHVDDDGPGVPIEQRDHVFDRFSRLDEGRNRDHGGAGLGLAIVRRIVELHGGTITCSDAPTGGARFTITLRADPRGP